MTMISTREAARRLQGVGLTRRRSQRLLAAGFAGESRRTAGVTWWDEETVDALASRRSLEDADIDQACPWGLFVARRDVDLRDSSADQRAAVQDGWDLSIYTRVWIGHTVRQHGHLPLVVSVCGYVALGAELVGLDASQESDGRTATRLDLREPGAWFDALRGCRLATGPGPPWVIRGWQPLTPVARRGVPRPVPAAPVGRCGP